MKMENDSSKKVFNELILIVQKFRDILITANGLLYSGPMLILLKSSFN